MTRVLLRLGSRANANSHDVIPVSRPGTKVGKVTRGERKPSRQFQFDAISVKEIRALTQLSQPKFARILDVDVGTLRNWEQGRREPTGPVKALLRAIKNDPKAVLRALAS